MTFFEWEYTSYVFIQMKRNLVYNFIDVVHCCCCWGYKQNCSISKNLGSTIIVGEIFLPIFLIKGKLAAHEKMDWFFLNQEEKIRISWACIDCINVIPSLFYWRNAESWNAASIHRQKWEFGKTAVLEKNSFFYNLKQIVTVINDRIVWWYKQNHSLLACCCCCC